MITSYIKIPGFTGRGSISQVSRQINTKLYKGSIKTIRVATFGKMITYEVGYSVFNTIVSGLLDAYEYIKYVNHHSLPVIPSYF